MKTLVELREKIQEDILIAMEGHEEVFNPIELCDDVAHRFAEYFNMQKDGKIGVWFTPDELKSVQTIIMKGLDELQNKRESLAKLSLELKSISLSFDNQQEDDNGQGSKAALEQDR